MEDYSFRSTTFDYLPSYLFNISYENSTTRYPWNETDPDTSIQFSNDLYDVPAGLIALLSFFYGSISVLAVVGNSLVMWIVATSRRMQNVTNCFIANLALADIVIGLFAIPFQFQAALLQKWNLPHFMCPFCPFVQVLSVNVSVFTLTAIAVDRHRAILNPLSARPSKKIAKIIIAGIWILGLALAAPMVVALRVTFVKVVDIDTEKLYRKPFCSLYNLSEKDMVIYRTILLFLQYLTPLCVISFVYARMALRLWGSRAPGNAQDSRDANLMKNKKKVIKMLVIVVALFTLCWLPLQTYQVLQTWYPSINEYHYINIVFFCCDWLAMSNSCYNPFIYGIYNEKFKREFKQRFPCGRNTWNHTPPTDSSYDMDKSHSIVHTRHSSLRSNYDWRRSTRQQQTMSTHQFGQNRASWNHQSLHNRKQCNISNNYVDLDNQKLRNPNKNNINFCLGNEVKQANSSRLNRSLSKSSNGALPLRENEDVLYGDETCDRFVTELYVFSPGSAEDRNGFGKIDEINEFNA